MSWNEIDRLEMNHLLADLEHIQQRVQELEKVIAERCGTSEDAVLLSSMPGVSTTLKQQPIGNCSGLTDSYRNGPTQRRRLGGHLRASVRCDRRALACAGR